MLYFFSEGAIILFLSVIIMIICNRIFTINDVEIVLLLFVAIFLLYVSGRYIISGIEYTDIATEHSYKKELKNIFSRTCSFVVIFMLLYLNFFRYTKQSKRMDGNYRVIIKCWHSLVYH